MNCSESQRLRTLLSRLLLELHHRGNASGLGAGPGPSMGMGVVPDPFVGREATSAKGDEAYLYILLIMIFYACLAGGLILAYTRSRKLVEAKDEPAQACAAHEWCPIQSKPSFTSLDSSPNDLRILSMFKDLARAERSEVSVAQVPLFIFAIVGESGHRDHVGVLGICVPLGATRELRYGLTLD
ncbi:potassium voltage-gated channel subfamily E regulatory beta subunit 5 [Suricata suricatta]|uniref:potassium voltage-gated channel subfamily E regulatory beta subunit 5 n=1 Tax=Suricata suricatta TaxID=37032 RepID=UPI001155D92D|nr:potassium voltage-gated channel subfamily E regulatory beta subunit 5 [Suricata suricatta]